LILGNFDSSEKSRCQVLVKEARSTVADDDVAQLPNGLGIGSRKRPGRLFEQPEQAIGNESGSRRIDVAIALGVLTVREEALWHNEM
jgi:hypothetical protein